MMAGKKGSKKIKVGKLVVKNHEVCLDTIDLPFSEQIMQQDELDKRRRARLHGKTLVRRTDK